MRGAAARIRSVAVNAAATEAPAESAEPAESAHLAESPELVEPNPDL